jgi:hypothetical protein
VKKWLAIRKKAGRKIDPKTAEVDWTYELTLDPYGSTQSSQRNTVKWEGNTSLGHPEVTYGSGLAIYQAQLGMRCGKN